jgi:hypothetical protein
VFTPGGLDHRRMCRRGRRAAQGDALTAPPAATVESSATRSPASAGASRRRAARHR